MSEDDEIVLDPSVAALLEPCDSGDVSELRTRIALMKLQQARVRGNSDYAAKIMEHAIEEGARDRHAWTLLDDHIKKLDEQVKNVSEKKDENKEEEKDTEEEEDKGDEDAKDGEDKEAIDDKEEESDEVTSEEVKRLKKEIEDEKARTKSMEDLLVECLEEELGSVRKEQESIQDREARLKARIRSLQLTIQKLPDESTKKLQDGLKEIHENQCMLMNATCAVCHEQTATKAVIPCGHLCLCEGCNASITKLDSVHRKCPLCRGQLLSVLRVYTSK